MKTANLSNEYHMIKRVLGDDVKNITTDTISNFQSFGASLMKHAIEGSHKYLTGSDLESQALIWQWIEDRIKAVSNTDITLLASKLNRHLECNVYIVSNVFSLADIVLFYAMHSFMSDLTVHEKQSKYTNVSRWFSHIQHHELLASVSLSKVCYILNSIYLN